MKERDGLMPVWFIEELKKLKINQEHIIEIEGQEYRIRKISRQTEG